MKARLQIYISYWKGHVQFYSVELYAYQWKQLRIEQPCISAFCISYTNVDLRGVRGENVNGKQM